MSTGEFVGTALGETVGAVGKPVVGETVGAVGKPVVGETVGAVGAALGEIVGSRPPTSTVTTCNPIKHSDAT